MPASRPDAALARDGLRARLAAIFEALNGAYGAETWHWDATHVRGPMDVLAGAVLVQHTTWMNAERALETLRAAGALDPAALARMAEEAIATLVRVSGTPSIKARRLQALARAVEAHGGLAAFLAQPTAALRAALLATHGIGPETADAILLYAAGRRVFEIDAYTKRLFRRLGLGPEDDGYDAWQAWFHDALGTEGEAEPFQRYHALIVLHGQARCRARPRCEGCVVGEWCSYARGSRVAGSG
jgi:endonuclease-3 related protein